MVELTVRSVGRSVYLRVGLLLVDRLLIEFNLGSTCNPLKYSHMQFYNFDSTLRNLDDVLVHLYRRIVCLKRLLDLIAIVTSVLITWSLFSGKKHVVN